MNNRKVSGIQKLVVICFLVISVALGGVLSIYHHIVTGVVTFIIVSVLGWLLSDSIRVANQWEKAVVLRLGNFSKLAGPGLFRIIPFVDTVPTYVDQRVVTTQFRAEQTLTKDTIPVNVDAVLFWMVWDVKKAALEVANYSESVSWAAQTALRDVIGKTNLENLLSTRDTLDVELKALMDERTEPWGITIQSVQIRDVKIPGSLQDAMSRAAQAEKERTARTILGEAEKQVAESFVAAAEMYNSNPVALQLRAMNILYEGIKEKASLIVVPSSLADATNIGNILALANSRNFEVAKSEEHQ
ncbi:slipin family protein [Alicyclobacillus sp. ALC3]|uniref:slipin family protein n=1 Tax=Alicyclobacillus sp. ALC3 TaxID=2796143 RepID=UPI002378D3D3|nr:slipin family protein [Alicyclobacillus sp. ALC3]WDL98460.1 slipin family protein [Alicyclobacillus sp. ALC3]